MHKVIFDTDPGIDDAMALLFLARAREVEIVGVTTCFGNGTIEATTANALGLCTLFGIDAPVARGAAGPLHGGIDAPAAHVHGEGGLGGIRLPTGGKSVHTLSAAAFIVETCRRHPAEITLVAVARMTNLALSLKLEPALPTLVKSVIVMGGAFGHHGHSGNVTPAAEANMFGDPQAADEITAAGWPLTLVPLDATQQTIMSRAYLERIGMEGGAAGSVVARMARFYLDFHRDQAGVDGIYTHDPSAVAYLLDSSIFETREGPIRVVTEGIAIGQTIQKGGTRTLRAPDWDDRPSHTICIDANAERLLDLYYRTVTAARG